MSKRPLPSHTAPSRLSSSDGVSLLLVAAMGAIAVLWIATQPPLWWDEGWTLTVARTWVEQGHYGLLLEGEPASPRLSASFPQVASVAFSLRLFGMGIWQGRLPGVIYTIGALLLLVWLARSVYRPSVAALSMLVLLVLMPHPILHPSHLGRQVLAEQIMLFLLLAGYAGLFLSLSRIWLFIVPVVVIWGLALTTKAQPLPFWAASLAVPAGVLALRRTWNMAALLAVVLVGSYLASRGWAWLIQAFLNNQTLMGKPLEGLYEVTAFVPVLAVRLKALSNIAIFCLPVLVGACYALWRWWRTWPGSAAGDDTTRWTMQAVLLAFVGSWFAWYILLSVGFLRYIFPPMVVGSIFLATLLDDSVRSVLARRGEKANQQPVAGWQKNAHRLGHVLLLLLLAWNMLYSLKTLAFITRPDPNAYAVMQTATYLNTHTAPDALVESYESELFFFLQRPYHFPPSQVHVTLNRRTFLKQDVPVHYDPLEADPDYLVVGAFGSLWELYDPVIERGDFRLVQTFGHYRLYERVRAAGVYASGK